MHRIQPRVARLHHVVDIVGRGVLALVRFGRGRGPGEAANQRRGIGLGIPGSEEEDERREDAGDCWYSL